MFFLERGALHRRNLELHSERGILKKEGEPRKRLSGKD